MKETWRTRLKTALRAARLSQRAVSLAADMGPGYVHSILKEGKDPTIENLLRVCEVAKISPAYVILDYELTPDLDELLRLWAAAPVEARQGILQILAAHKAV